MDGTRIVLVRHGESMAQEDQVVGGHVGCKGLSDRGRRQVEALRDRLARTGELCDAAALYASVMPRAVETAEIIAPALRGLGVVQECDFCEHHPGEGDGLPWSEFELRYPRPEGPWDPDLRRDPGGETWNEMAARVSRGLDAIVERHPGQLVVVACHGGVIIQSMAKWLGLQPADSGRAWMNPINASLTEWRFASNPFSVGTLPIELVRFNDAAHLAGAG
jgi:probable phosphoglycerate mutase